MVSRLLGLKVSLIAAVCGVFIGALVVLLIRGGDERIGTAGAVAASRPVAGAPSARSVYRNARDGVVSIVSTSSRSEPGSFPFGGRDSGQTTSLGSGIVLDKSGYILTNEHVIDGAGKVSVSFGEDRSVTRAAEVVGKDSTTDVALLKVNASGLSLHPLTLGDSSTLAVGDTTYALGNPLGYTDSFSQGIVSGLDRHMTGPNGFSIDHVIQTDAAMNPGNSGGPLLDSSGRVIGVNSQVAAAGGTGSAAEGIGFAVPIDTAKKVVSELRSNGKASHAYLGVSTVSITGSLKGEPTGADAGALVESVQRGSPAAVAGLRAGDRREVIDGTPVVLGGDVIVSVNGEAVAGSDELVSAIGSLDPGTEVRLAVVRDGKRVALSAKLASQPAQAPSG